LGGEAILHNPNGIKVTVKEIDISVTVNEKAVGKVNQTGEIEVPANAEFEVPLVVDFAPNDVYDNLLSGLMTIISKGQLEVHYKGFIKMKAAGITFKVPIDHQDEVKI
ncbi:MAG: LEA type 2 family protein, partial [Cyclobacteriaceae bacterium]|nr:LEA type 2 family protein [Cyclobacteriaceae bacterium]